jgi:TolA-binding protein
MQSLAAMGDRPTSAEVHEMLQRTLADAHGAASATAAAASSAAVRPLQQQLDQMCGEVGALRGQLQLAQQQLEQLKEQQVRRVDFTSSCKWQLWQTRAVTVTAMALACINVNEHMSFTALV